MRLGYEDSVRYSIHLLLTLALFAGCDVPPEPADSEAGESGAQTGTGSGSETGVLYDVGSPETGGVGDCAACDDATLEFSYIWIANSMQGTVFKLDTTTLTELGRP